MLTSKRVNKQNHKVGIWSMSKHDDDDDDDDDGDDDDDDDDGLIRKLRSQRA